MPILNSESDRSFDITLSENADVCAVAGMMENYYARNYSKPSLKKSFKLISSAFNNLTSEENRISPPLSYLLY